MIKRKEMTVWAEDASTIWTGSIQRHTPFTWLYPQWETLALCCTQFQVQLRRLLMERYSDASTSCFKVVWTHKVLSWDASTRSADTVHYVFSATPQSDEKINISFTSNNEKNGGSVKMSKKGKTAFVYMWKYRSNSGTFSSLVVQSSRKLLQDYITVMFEGFMIDDDYQPLHYHSLFSSLVPKGKKDPFLSLPALTQYTALLEQRPEVQAQQFLSEMLPHLSNLIDLSFSSARRETIKPVLR